MIDPALGMTLRHSASPEAEEPDAPSANAWIPLKTLRYFMGSFAFLILSRSLPPIIVTAVKNSHNGSDTGCIDMTIGLVQLLTMIDLFLAIFKPYDGSGLEEAL